LAYSFECTSNNYHPMALLPSIASYSSNIADLLTKPLSRHHFDTLIGDAPTAPTTSVISTPVADTADPVDLTPTSVASTAPVASTVVASVSDSVPLLHPNPLPIVLDTGASYSRTPLASDFLPVAQAPYGLFRSAASLVSDSTLVIFSSTPVDPCTLITGEDTVVPVDLSSLDTIIASDSGSSFTKVSFDIRQFGTASLTFIFSSNLSLIKVFVTPTQVDWIHWVPLPRLILPESYFHIFGLDYLQAFALFHLIPIWIYCLLHFAVNLE